MSSRPMCKYCCEYNCWGECRPDLEEQNRRVTNALYRLSCVNDRVARRLGDLVLDALLEHRSPCADEVETEGNACMEDSRVLSALVMYAVANGLRVDEDLASLRRDMECIKSPNEITQRSLAILHSLLEESTGK